MTGTSAFLYRLTPAEPFEFDPEETPLLFALTGAVLSGDAPSARVTITTFEEETFTVAVLSKNAPQVTMNLRIQEPVIVSVIGGEVTLIGNLILDAPGSEDGECCDEEGCSHTHANAQDEEDEEDEEESEAETRVTAAVARHETPKAQAQPQAQQKPQLAQPKAQPQQKPQTQPKAQPQAQPKAQAQQKPQQVAQPQAQPQAQPKAQPTAQPQQKPQPQAAQPQAGTKVQLGGGLRYEVTKGGETSTIKASTGDKIKVRYRGCLAKTGKQFDKGVIEFKLGAGEVIKGWDMGLKGAALGESRKILIPSSLGYGAKGAGRDIPPHSDLVFETEVIGVKGVVTKRK